MIVCKPLGPKLLGFQSKGMEASEPKGSALETKGLESTWIVTGSCPHSKADSSGVKCPCLHVTETRNNKPTIEQSSVYIQKRNTTRKLLPLMELGGCGEGTTGKGAGRHLKTTNIGSLGAQNMGMCFLLIGEVCVHGFHVYSFNQL